MRRPRYIWLFYDEWTSFDCKYQFTDFQTDFDVLYSLTTSQLTILQLSHPSLPQQSGECIACVYKQCIVRLRPQPSFDNKAARHHKPLRHVSHLEWKNSSDLPTTTVTKQRQSNSKIWRPSSGCKQDWYCCVTLKIKDTYRLFWPFSLRLQERNSKTYSRLLLCLQTLKVTSKDIKDNDNREKTTFTAWGEETDIKMRSNHTTSLA